MHSVLFLSIRYIEICRTIQTVNEVIIVVILGSLPCANLDERIVLIVHVNHKIKIAVVAIMSGIIILCNLYSIYLSALLKMTDVIVGETDVDIFLSIKTVTQIIQIRVLVISVVFHNVVEDSLFPKIGVNHTCLLHYIAHNDNSIISKD